jgi:hypothetical protein
MPEETMSTDAPTSKTLDRLVKAYNTMLGRVEQTIQKAEKDVMPTLEKNIEAAQEKATELEELTREEAERIGTYLRRDLVDAANYLAETGDELRDWLRFDLELIEDRLLDSFTGLVDRTRLELQELAQQAMQYGEWHTGEIVGIGTLRCKSCGELLHFHATGHIPPCPACHGTTFKRISSEDE